MAFRDKAKNNVHKVNVFPSSLCESKKRHKTKNIVYISVMRHYLPRKHERSISLETILRSFRSLRSLPLLPLLLLNTFAAAAFYLWVTWKKLKLPRKYCFFKKRVFIIALGKNSIQICGYVGCRRFCKNYSSEIHNKLLPLLNLPKHKIILFSEIWIVQHYLKVYFSKNVDHHYRCMRITNCSLVMFVNFFGF